MSFNVSSSGLVSLATVLPFISNKLYRESKDFNFIVFSISITYTGCMLSTVTVKTPNILAISDLGLDSRWAVYDGSISMSKSISCLVIVLIIKRLSCEKKKKLPERPDPSPALNIFSRLYLGWRDSLNIARLSLAQLWIRSKYPN